MSDDIDRAIEDWLRRVDAKTQKVENATDQGLLKAAFFAEGKAKTTANQIFSGSPPTNQQGEEMWAHTGLLTSSIGSGMNPNAKHSAIIYCTAKYASFVEYGTGIYCEKGDGRMTPWKFVSNTGVLIYTQGMRAKPFMYPSVFNNQQDIQNIIKGYISKEVK